MKSHEAIKKAIKTDAAEHGRRLGLQTRTIYRWMEPTDDYTDSGAYNPLDRVESIIAESIERSHATEDAHAPIIYLATRFGGTYLPPLSRNDSLKSLALHACNSIERFGRLMSTLGDAMEDGKIVPAERREISLAGIDAIQSIAAVILAAEEACK